MVDSSRRLLEKWPRYKRDTDVECLLPEILAYIFSYLTIPDKGRSAQVCKTWRDACNRKIVWRGCIAKLHMKRNTAVVLESLEKRGIRSVQILSIRKTLVLNFKYLQSLNFTGCYTLTDALIIQAFQQLTPNLERLILSLCKQIGDASIAKIVKCAENLKDLQLVGCFQITSNSLQLISNSLHKLQNLNVRSCKGITDRGISFICGVDEQIPIQSLYNLTHLILQDCQSITDDALSYLIELKNLTNLNISFCAGITDAGFRSVAKMQSLLHLNARSCDNITDIAIAYLVEAGSASNKLQVIDLAFCDRLTDLALFHISRGFSNLIALSLSSCRITDDGLTKLAKSQTFLRALDIGQCSSLTDATAYVIAENLINLQSIDVYGCVKMTTVGLERLTNMDNLQYFNISLWSNAERQLFHKF